MNYDYAGITHAGNHGFDANLVLLKHMGTVKKKDINLPVRNVSVTERSAIKNRKETVCESVALLSGLLDATIPPVKAIEVRRTVLG